MGEDFSPGFWISMYNKKYEVGKMTLTIGGEAKHVDASYKNRCFLFGLLDTEEDNDVYLRNGKRGGYSRTYMSDLSLTLSY